LDCWFFVSKITESGSQQSPQKMENSDALVRCVICLDTLQNPRTLPCLHTSCQHCLEALVKSSSAPHKCPLCRSTFLLTSGGVADLPASSFVVNRVSALSASSLSVGSALFDPNHVKCELCEEETEEGDGATTLKFCAQCGQFVCGACQLVHDKIKATRHHKLTSLEDAIAQKPRTNESACCACEDHGQQEAVLFCVTCKAPACLVCVASSHGGHFFSLLPQAAADIREAITLTVGKARR